MHILLKISILGFVCLASLLLRMLYARRSQKATADAGHLSTRNTEDRLSQIEVIGDSLAIIVALTLRLPLWSVWVLAGALICNLFIWKFREGTYFLGFIVLRLLGAILLICVPLGLVATEIVLPMR